MNGKEKCKALKEIRKQIALNNDIEYVVEECKHKGNCRGTCPKCEAEVIYLEKELEKRRLLGRKIALAGISAGIAASFSACSLGVIDIPVEELGGVAEPPREEYILQGEAMPVEEPPYDGVQPYDENKEEEKTEGEDKDKEDNEEKDDKKDAEEVKEGEENKTSEDKEAEEKKAE